MNVISLTFVFCCEVTAIIIKCACATVCVAQVFLWVETKSVFDKLQFVGHIGGRVFNPRQQQNVVKGNFVNK